MWPLLILGIACFFILLERIIFFHRVSINVKSFLDGIKNLLEKRRLVEALTLCEENTSPVANTLKSVLMNYDKTQDAMLASAKNAALIEIPIMEKGLRIISFIARIAPFIGFMGTCLAVIQSFDRMNQIGPYANTVAFSGDISQALITTLTGIFIGIIAYSSHHFLSMRVHSIVQDTEWAIHNLVEFLLHNLPEDKK